MKRIYLEIAEKLSSIGGLKWIDLWHNQINFIETEHEFPAPAAFIAIRSESTQDIAEKVQDVKLQVTVYLYFETLADSYRDSWNQDSALEFLDLLDSIYKELHGSNSSNYSEMRRTSLEPVDTGSAGNLYSQSFSCLMRDYTAMKEYEEQQVNDFVLERDNSLPVYEV